MRFLNVRLVQLFLLCALGLSVSTTIRASIEREFIDVISSKDKPYLVASVFREKNPVPRALIKFEDGFRGGDNSKEVAVLKQYYEFMVNGEPKKAASLYYAGDGSRERFIAGLLAMPDRYAGYPMLERVDFLNAFGWGPFLIYELQLSGGQVGKIKWREAVICTKQKCFISNQIDGAESNIDGFADVRQLLNRAPAAQDKLFDAFNAYDNKAVFLPTNAMTYSSVQNTQYPMTFSFEMEKVTPFEIDLSKEKIPSNARINGINVSFLQEMYLELQKLAPLVQDEALKTQTNDDPQKAQVIDEYNKVIDKFSSSDATRDIYLYSVFGNSEDDKIEFTREWYHPVAAIQRISRWTSIRVLGFIPQGTNRTALFFQPTSTVNNDTRIEPIQALAIEKTAQGPKLMLTNFSNNAAQTINFALEASVLDVLGKKYAEAPTLIYNR